MREIRLNDADRAVYEIALVFAARRLFEPERLELWRLELLDLLPRATRMHAGMGPLAEACDALVELGDLRTPGAMASGAWSRVIWRLASSLEAMQLARAGAAVERARREAA